MEFYKNVGKTLLVFNLISIFFLLLTIFAYSLIQYMFQPLVAITNYLFSDAAAVASLITILDLAMLLPSMLDYAFLLLVMVLIFDLILISWRTETGNLFVTLGFALIGFPIWILIMGWVSDIKEWALNFLGSAITYNINMRFYTYIQNNSLELSIIVFMLAIAVRSIDWNNIKYFNKAGVSLSGVSADKNIEEILKQ